MKKIPVYLIVFCLLFVGWESLSQSKELLFDKISGTDGIALGKINNMTQDGEGFLWLSDQDNRAIIRYDGRHMEMYQYEPNNPEGLGGYYPECLFADPSGLIWIGFYGQGVDSFDPRTNTFTHYRLNPNDPESLSDDMVSAILVDREGNLWVGTNTGLNLLDRKTGKFKHYIHDAKDPTSLSHNVVRSLYEDESGTIWVGTGFFGDFSGNGGLNRLDLEKGTFTRYMHDPSNENSLVDNRVRSIFEDSEGNFWVGTGKNGLHKMNKKTGDFQRFIFDPDSPNTPMDPEPTESSSHITFIEEDSNNNLWIGTFNEGIHRFNLQSKEMTTYFSNDKFPDKSGWWMHTSEDGLLWVSTQETNLYQADIENYKIPFKGLNSAALCFYEDSSRLYIGTTLNGMVREDLVSGESVEFKHSPEDLNSISNDMVTSIIRDKDGLYWIGTDDGLNSFDEFTENFTQYKNEPNNPESIGLTGINVVYEGSNSNLWIGHYGAGLDQFDKETKKFDHYIHDPMDSNSISSNVVLSILEDINTDFLWLGFGAGGGVNKFNKNTGHSKQYLQGMRVRNIYRDQLGILWIGTQSGFFKYDAGSDSFSPYTIAATTFTVNSQIWAITADLNDNIWASSSTGILRFSKDRNHLVTFDESNGVQGGRFGAYGISGSTLRAMDGKIFFGGVGGYYTFSPEKLKSVTRTPNLYFFDFQLAGDTNGGMDQSSGSGQEIIKLEHSENTFSLSYSVLEFRYNENRKIYYKLENYDEHWNESNVQDRATYFRVPPGNYVFTIRIPSETSGGWVEKKIMIEIVPPWWQTWPAFGLYFILVVSGIFVVDRYQRQRLIKMEREKTKDRELAQAREIEKAYTELKITQTQLIQSEKMASLGELTAGIAHEIQNPLNFVNNFSDVNKELVEELREEIKKGNEKEAEAILKDIEENEKKIMHHGQRADAIVKGMLQHSRAGGGEKEPTDINELADEYLRLSYHGLRAKDKSFNADFKTELDPNLPKVNMVPQDIGRVLLNLINNAFYAVSIKEKEVSAEALALPTGSSGREARAQNSEADPSPQNESVGQASASGSTNLYKPTVTVSTELLSPSGGGKGEVKISVKDNGPGIPEDIKDKIFQPFFTTKSTGQGTGLGLSMSYDIVTKGHGGELLVESKKGQGTEFTVVLPISG